MIPAPEQRSLKVVPVETNKEKLVRPLVLALNAGFPMTDVGGQRTPSNDPNMALSTTIVPAGH